MDQLAFLHSSRSSRSSYSSISQKPSRSSLALRINTDVGLGLGDIIEAEQESYGVTIAGAQTENPRAPPSSPVEFGKGSENEFDWRWERAGSESASAVSRESR